MEAPQHNCHECGEQATVFVTLVKAGKVITQSYCHKHAESLGIFNPTSYAFLQHLEPSDRIMPAGVIMCPKCGLSQFDFNHMGRLGCAHCYTVFRDQIVGVLSQIQPGTQHVGKVPRRQEDRNLLENRLHNLRDTLQHFVQ
ncbi:MAG: hypothetical protein B7X06_03585, partial [Verrucomicrobia bacterium 21-51-4]